MYEELTSPRTTVSSVSKIMRIALRIVLWGAASVVVAILVWQGITAKGNPDPTAASISPTVAILDISVLVFREGLESILVLAAIIASMAKTQQELRRPVVLGTGLGLIATLITWFVAVGIVDQLS